ncbi:MAG: SWIM zinc finger family protein [Synechococcales bacterium]|nr:SWIM zinc finger family protein [Synechococcales bacterium]
MIPNLNEATIHRHTVDQSFERGRECYQRGAVVSLVQRGTALSALVEGSDVHPYRVRIGFDKGGITSAVCTCPYDFEGWCKHIVAVLLTCVHNPDHIEQRAELAELLGPLSREQLETVLKNLVDEWPEWVDTIEQKIVCLSQAAAQPQPSKASVRQSLPRRTLVDPAPIERQVQYVIDSYVGQWNDAPAIDEVRQIVCKADKFLEQGDGNNALIILRAVTRAYTRDWMNLDGSSGESGIFFEELDESLTEALLSAELSAGDRQQWQHDLETWQADVEDYGVDSFHMSLTALEQGWDYGPLQRVLQGEMPELGTWAEEAPDYADDLARIRLRILERQGRYAEYLHLAEVEGLTDRYLQMLAKLGRTEDAIAQAHHQMRTTDEALTLAQTLREQGNLEQALHIAYQGLTLDGYSKHQLAEWTSELAAGMGQPDIALKARITAFQTYPSLADYQKLQELAGEQWADLKPDLLSALRDKGQYGWEAARVDIFLAEGLLDEAIATVDQMSFYQSETIQAVMDAAVAYRPDWVIENARQQAESIMDAGKAKYYSQAIEWLRRVRAAYLQLGQPQVWQQYRADLMRIHSRKYKLTSMLQGRELD